MQSNKYFFGCGLYCFESYLHCYNILDFPLIGGIFSEIQLHCVKKQHKTHKLSPLFYYFNYNNAYVTRTAGYGFPTAIVANVPNVAENK